MSNDAVRFCSMCGHLGEVSEYAFDCCPDGLRAQYVHKDIAELARKGFAAPDMYEALEELTAAVSLACIPDAEESSDVQRALSRALAAVAKARGQA